MTETLAAGRVPARDELLAAALEQFATTGFAATSLQQIADLAGYAKSNVLYHFGSKEAVLDAAIGPTVDALEVLVRDFPRGSAAAGERAGFIERFVDFLFAHRLAVNIVVNQGQSLRGLPVADRASAAMAALAVAICDEHPTVDEQLRFGVALAGAAYSLVAGESIFGDSRPIDPLVARGALIDILTELLAPAPAGD